MRIFIVTFELASAGVNYQQVVQKVKANRFWARLTNYCYLIVSERQAVQVRDDILTVMGRGDRLFVSASPPPSAWFGMPPDVVKWIHENQPKYK